MTTLNKEQQKELTDQLDAGQAVYLRCDGYLVFAQLRRVKTNSLGIVVYINGQFKGKWMHYGDDTPLLQETIRFFRPSVRNKYAPKSIKQHEKIFGKRETKKMGLYKKITVYLPYWLRPAPFIKHLIKHNKAIEILSYTEHTEALEQIKTVEATNEQTN